MKSLILLIGLPASGKTTLIEAGFEDAVIVRPDDHIGYEDGGWTTHDAVIAWKKADEMFDELLQSDEDTTVVFDAMFLSPKTRYKYIRKAKDAGVHVSAIFLDTPYSVCLARNLSRPEYRKVPDDLMMKFAGLLQEPSKDEGFDFVSVVRFKKEESS